MGRYLQRSELVVLMLGECHVGHPRVCCETICSSEACLTAIRPLLTGRYVQHREGQHSD